VQRWLDGLPRPVAVTGGTGFVGSHLVDTLCSAGLVPRVLVRAPESPRWISGRKVEWSPGSLGDYDALRRLVAGAGTVFHLAGVVRSARAVDFDNGNRVGTGRLVDAVAGDAPGARFVHVSSLAAAGPSPDPAGVGPEAEPHPVSHYGRSKLAAELEARRAPLWVILRPPAIYGPRDTDVLEFFRMANRGLALVPGGERWISVAYVADVVRATIAAATGEHSRIYHLGEPEPCRIEELLHAMADAGGRSVRVLRIPGVLVSALAFASGGLWHLGWRRVALTPDKARELLARHWTARTRDSMADLGIDDWVRFSDGARQTWGWYRSHGWLS
jgi:nucleoside-diphosphate-sugar epimerase